MLEIHDITLVPNVKELSVEQDAPKRSSQFVKTSYLIRTFILETCGSLADFKAIFIFSELLQSKISFYSITANINKTQSIEQRNLMFKTNNGICVFTPTF